MVNRIRSKFAENCSSSSSTSVTATPPAEPLTSTARILPKQQRNVALAMQHKFPDSKRTSKSSQKSETTVLSTKASPEDLPAIRQFFDSLDEESRTFRLGTYKEIAAMIIDSLAKNSGPDSAALIIKDSAGCIVGIVDFADNSTQDDRVADIGIVVGKSYRQGGIGSSLLKEIEDLVQQEGYDFMGMTVDPKNTKMINWMHNKKWKKSNELAPLFRFTKHLVLSH